MPKVTVKALRAELWARASLVSQKIGTLGGKVRGVAGSWLQAWLCHVKPACEMREPSEQTGILTRIPSDSPRDHLGSCLKSNSDVRSPTAGVHTTFMTGSLCTFVFSSLWATLKESPRGQNPSTAADMRRRSQPSELYLLLSLVTAECGEYGQVRGRGRAGAEGGGGRTHSQAAPYHLITAFQKERGRDKSSLELRVFRVTQNT